MRADISEPFVSQLKRLCPSFPTRAKWVFVPAHFIGWMLGDRLVLEGTDWANLRFVTPLDIALRMGAPFLVERGIDPSADGLSIVTATTVGYGDISPSTTEGRLIAIALMLVGIGFISILTATVASFFLDQESEDRTRELAQIHERLQQVERKQDSTRNVRSTQRALPTRGHPASRRRI